MAKHEPTTSVVSDHWTKRANDNYGGWESGNGKFGHYEGRLYNKMLLDGSGKVQHDYSRTLITREIDHNDPQTIEQAWRDYFDEHEYEDDVEFQ